MKKLILLLAVCLFTSGCKPSDTTTVKATQKAYQYYVIEFEGCEYIVWSGYEKGGICHKGNCKFCGAK